MTRSNRLTAAPLMQQGEIVYLKWKRPGGIQLQWLGRIETIYENGTQCSQTPDTEALVCWHDGTKSFHRKHEMISLNQKLKLAQHDVQRFAWLIEQKEKKA